MLWAQHALPQARIITLDTMRKLGAQATFTSHELYQAAHAHFPQAQLSKNLRPPLNEEPRPKNLKEKVQLRVQPVQDKLPPHPDHPIRSVRYVLVACNASYGRFELTLVSSFRYLKQIILDDFERRGLIKKVHVFREPTEEELAQRDERVRTIRVFPRDSKGRTTGEPPVAYKRVDLWNWHVLPDGEKELARGFGLDLSKLNELSKKDADAKRAQEREEKHCGPRIVVWPTNKS